MRAKSLRLMGVALAAALTMTLVLALTAGAGPGHRGGAKGLKAKLTGAAEVPGPGDADGKGRARILVLKQFDAVCFRLRWRDIAAPTDAHIHKGAPDVAGPVVVPLFDDDSVRERGCVDGVDRDLLRDIKRNPSDYYVNIHNADFPGGAIRGQLSRKGGRRR
jgi:hypothetical protein